VNAVLHLDEQTPHIHATVVPIDAAGKLNGPELISHALQDWCAGQGVALHWIQPASPTQNAYVERFNGSFRRELLNGYLFATLRQVREHCQLWQYDYNHLRPHEALNFMTPIEFRQAT